VRQGPRVPRVLNAQDVYRLQRTAAARRQLAEAQAEKDNVTPAVVKARRDEALLNLMPYSGLRLSEVASLCTDDVEIYERSGKVIVRSGKGRKHRGVLLHMEARQVQAAYLEVWPQDESESLFLGQRGSLGTRGVQLRLEALGEAANLEGLMPHVLRHTSATRLLRETEADLVTVAALLGHSSVATTAIYAQPNETDLVEAVEELT
jgi:site-specific recombinase XerD